MADVKAVPVASKWAGVTYTYNGAPFRMKINDCCHESAEVVEKKLKSAELKVEDVSKEWLHAQLLFRSVARPGPGVPRTRRKMFAYLQAHNKFLGNGYYAGRSVDLNDVFHGLEERWSQGHPELSDLTDPLAEQIPHNDSACWCFAHEWRAQLRKVAWRPKDDAPAVVKQELVADQPTLPVAESQIRGKERVVETSLVQKKSTSNAQESSINSAYVCKKRKLQPPTPEPKIDNGAGPSSWVAQPSGAPPTPPEHVDRLPREVATHVASSENPLWRATLDEHHQFKMVNYMSYTAGTYMIQCPLLDTRYPDLVGQLSITITHLGWQSTKHGMLEAYINLGLFKGPAMLGLDSDCISEYLWATAAERRGKGIPASYENSEVESLCTDALEVAARKRPAGDWSNLEIPHLRDLPALDIDTSTLPEFQFQARLGNPTNEFYRSGTYRVTFGEVNMDERYLRLHGTITIPEIGEGDLEFAGLKVFRKSHGALPQRWIDVPTSKVHMVK